MLKHTSLLLYEKNTKIAIISWNTLAYVSKHLVTNITFTSLKHCSLLRDKHTGSLSNSAITQNKGFNSIKEQAWAIQI